MILSMTPQYCVHAAAMLSLLRFDSQVDDVQARKPHQRSIDSGRENAVQWDLNW